MTTPVHDKVASFPELRGTDAATHARVFSLQVWPHMYNVARAIGSTGAAEDVNRADAFTAHAAGETGFGAGLYWYNFGYIVGRGPAGSFVQKDQSAPGEFHDVLFRAYNSALEGAADYAVLIYYGARQDRSNPKAPLPRFLVAGADPDRYIVALRDSGYLAPWFTDAELVSGQRQRLELVRAATKSIRPSKFKTVVGLVAGAGVIAGSIALAIRR